MQTLNPSRIDTSSQLYRRAAGIEQQGVPLDRPATCAMCGAHLNAGDLSELVTAETFGEGFNNKLDMHSEGDVLCGDCVALWSKEFLQNYSKSYATSTGVYKLASSEDVQAFVLTPPSAPFVAIFNCRQQQHMIWRTRVSLSQDVLTVRIDDELVHINRQLALDGARAWRMVQECMKTIGMKGQPATIERTLSDFKMGSFREDVILAVTAHSPEGAEAIATLQRMRMPELWALCALRHIDQDAPETWPKPVQILPLSQVQNG